MALGEQLRLARMKLKATPSEVAAATRMKVQIVEALEREDFSEIAAPIYAKGFIRLYAEFVGLDPAPLVEEYTLKCAGGAAPSLQPELDDANSVQGTQKAPVPPDGDLFATPDEEPVEDEPPATAEEPVEPTPQQSMLHEEPARQGTLGGGAAATKAWDAVRQTIDTALSGCLDVGKGLFDRLSQLGGRFELASLKPSKSPTRAISLAIGVVLVLLFVISSLSRCIRRPDDEMLPPAEDATIQLAVPPPDPYVD